MQLVKTRFIVILILLAMAVSVSATPGNAEQLPSLLFRLNDKKVKHYSLLELKQLVPEEKIKIFDSEYGEIKQYRAFPFLPVLQKIYENRLNTSHLDAASFIAVDGYEATIDLDKFSHGRGAYLVFADLDIPDWQYLPGHDQVKPGPFYLVWYDKDKTTWQGYHYPWQIQTIALVSRADSYASIIPKETTWKEDNSSIMAGYELFKTRCQSCHAISGEGGKLGPDLNAPQNILSYRSKNIVRAFIKAPSQFRHSRMPDFPDLSEQQVNQIVDYLGHLGR